MHLGDKMFGRQEVSMLADCIGSGSHLVCWSGSAAWVNASFGIFSLRMLLSPK